MDCKTCFKCGKERPFDDFYAHKRMADGRLNKCKECTKSDSKKHRLENVERIRGYDRERGNRQKEGYCKEYRSRFPSKYKAHYLVNYHLKAGNLSKSPCEICGSERSVAHHDDYSKPLNVRWLCQAHHTQWHAANGEGLNP